MADPVLPTVEQCREFLRLVNVGREASGREAIERLDFDECWPSDPTNCLSARHLFEFVLSDEGYVGSKHVIGPDDGLGGVARALGMVHESADSSDERWKGYRIPAAIKVVTDPFDNETPGLRERMAEAGVI